MPNKKKNKFFACIIMVLLLGFLLNSCTPTTPGGANGKNVTNSGINSLSGQDIKLVWYMVGSRQQQDTALVMEKVNTVLKEKINASIELSVFAAGDEYDLKANTALAAGEPIDIVFTANWNANYNLNASSGYFTELNGYLEKYPAIKGILDEKFLNYSAVNGKNYAIPANKEKAHSWGYLLQKDLVKKYSINVEDITSIEAIEPFLEMIWKSERQVTPLLIAAMDAPFQLLDWDRISDDDIPGALRPDNNSSTIVNHFLAPETIDHYRLMQSWFNKGYIHQEAASMQNQLELMKSGRFFAATQSLKPGKAAEISAATGIEWIAVDITRPVMSNREATGALLAIPAASRNPESAFRFIELLYTDKELMNLIKFGLEDVHYRKVSENVIHLIDPIHSKYNPGYTWCFGDQFKDFLMDNEDPLKWDKFLEYNRQALALNSLGFVFDKTNVEAQASACKNVVQAYYKQLFTGSIDIDPTVIQFEKELKAAGVADLIDEMQKQYDQWLASQ